MKYSIIIPCYNSRKSIYACIKSAQSQTYKDLEIIIVDDGSTDNTSAVCEALAEKDHRVRLIKKSNGGQASARVAGVSAAKGRYIIFLDSDDELKNSFVGDADIVLSKYEPDLYCCGAVYDDKGTGNSREVKISNRPVCLGDEEIIRDIYPRIIEDDRGRYFTRSVWGKVFDRRLAKIAFTDCGAKIGEDAACVVPYISMSHRIYLDSKCNYIYVLNSESLTHSRRVISWEDPLRVAAIYEKMPFGQKIYPQVCRSVTHELFNVAMSRFCQDKSYKDTRREIINKLKSSKNLKYVKECSYSVFAPRQFLGMVAVRFRLIPVIYIASRIKYK